MEKLNMESVDIVDKNIEKIGKLFPNVIVESEKGKSIDFDLLKQELSKEIVEGNKEKYQLTWPGKKEAILLANEPTKNTLRPVREKSVDFDNTENIYIEGDNLEALKILQESYLNKIKCIYIDPPYNTGNDFIYNDKFKKDEKEELEESGQIDEYNNRLVTNTESNGKYHSDWLSMMYPRLKLARNLLTDDGLIYISIDDHEIENLIKMCDEIFGANCHINTISINMSNMSGPKVQHAIKGKRFPKLKEYIVIYAKNKGKYKMIIPKSIKESWDNEYNLIIPEFTEELLNQVEIQDIDKLNKMINGMKLISLNKYMMENNINTNDEEWKNKNAYRIFASKPNEALLKKASQFTYNQDIQFIKNSSGQNKLIKTDFNRNTKTARIELINALEKQFVYFGDHWSDIVTTGGIGQEGEVYYGNGKKPVKLIERVIQNSNNPNIVLDFFAGSASTAHAVMDYNNNNNNNLKYIMIQVDDDLDVSLSKASGENKEEIKEIIKFLDTCNRPHILSELGIERIIRSSNKIKQNRLFNNNIDYGFRVYKIDSSNMKDVYYKPNEYNQSQLDLFDSNIKEDRSSEDLLTQVILDLGLTLDLKIEEKNILNNKVYFVGNNSLIACFDDDIDINIVDEIAKYEPLKVVFKDDSFKFDNDKINLVEKFKKLLPGISKDSNFISII